MQPLASSPSASRLSLLHSMPSTATSTSWRGIGIVAVGMHRIGWDLQLTEYGDGDWRATFWVTGLVHSITGGSSYESEPWRAVQRAAWAVLNRPKHGTALDTL